MSVDLPVATTAFALLAGCFHVLVFVLESLRWASPRTWRAFGVTTQEEADTTRFLAFNQGFYNLFLAAGALLGVALCLGAHGLAAGVGLGMLVLATSSMLLASFVLVLADHSLARAAALQGVPPLLALGALLALR